MSGLFEYALFRIVSRRFIRTRPLESRSPSSPRQKTPGAGIVPIRSALPDQPASKLSEPPLVIPPAASWDNSRSAENQSRPPKAPEGHRTPRRFAQFGSLRPTRQRLGVRWPSTAFPSSTKHDRNFKHALPRSSTPNCHWPHGWDFAGERARPGWPFSASRRCP